MDTSDRELIEKIHHHFKRSDLTLSIAESCTGGLISHLLTNLPGASSFLDSSVVCYSTESKVKLLGVRRSLIKSHGAVSEKTAQAMAVAVRKKNNTDFSLSTTGNLGPNPMEDKRVGLVYIAVDWNRETVSKGMLFDGEREEIKHEAARAALKFLGEVLEVWA
ncbi:MAG TPA: CinA family protein [Thermodesulfovibrionales bacterium]|nr:CinA family protein [Thermodesulfovibrionales bacterium]